MRTDENGNTVVRTEPTRDDYLTAIRRVADQSDRVVKSTDVRDQSPYSVNEIVSEFGSWRDALETAGVDNESRLLQELHRVADKVGHQPSTTEMNQHGHVSATMYANYFGTYTDAVDKAFGTEGESDATDTDNEPAEGTTDDGLDEQATADETADRIGNGEASEETADDDTEQETADNETAEEDEILGDLVSEFDGLEDLGSS